jgi:hypothetical protein
MKKLTSKIAFLVVVAGLLLSCKNNNANTNTDGYGTDSTDTSIDSVAPPADTTNMNSGMGTDGTGTNATGAGTTGATGEGSTGSGSAGTTQKGNTSVRTDSTTTTTTPSR